MTVQPVVMVGFVPVALRSFAKLPSDSVVVIEEPDVVRKRDLVATAAETAVAYELIAWPYQLPGAADEFVNAHPRLRPLAVAPLQEYATPFAARLAERYGLPGAGYGAAQLLRDKELLRKVTAAAGIVNPESEPVSEPQDVRDFMAEHPGPVILKPANRQAAIGTKVLRHPSEVDEAWSECVVHDEGVMVPDRPIPLRMLVERYVTGHEYSVELLLDRGEPVFANVTDKVLFPGERPIELGHLVPAAVSDELRATLVEHTTTVLRSVGFGTGIVHCEWIVTGDGPCLVECAGRFAGDGIIELIERAYPVELVRGFWTLLAGRPLPAPLPERAERGAAVRFLNAEPGVVRSVEGLEEARAVPGVTMCDVSVRPGDAVRELRSSWDRIGSAIAVAATADEAMRQAGEALDRVEVKVLPA